MFEKNKDDILFFRENFSYVEELYMNYIAMRKAINRVEFMKYGKDDPFSSSEEFKQGFIAGCKIMSSILMDL